MKRGMVYGRSQQPRAKHATATIHGLPPSSQSSDEYRRRPGVKGDDCRASKDAQDEQQITSAEQERSLTMHC